ncbi:ISMsm7, transposase orfB [Nocardia brasiliensis ATCC 700358]|uniref:ISMsm7, transposase orfB n=1 Tax=Nocardia brasiliensis (strain ATCC 700358 / HUJEG-1) TaxID=1133849 RepID=K0EP50_NOCB7|nr:ISMsm7, transposase orfB [Nocardia brasiliensis ATCC 700358]
MWLTGITEHRTEERKLHLCAIKGCRSNRGVGYSIDERITAALAVAALRNTVAMRAPVATVVYSVRGSQFVLDSSWMVLLATGLRGSMRRVGTCGDNAAMEWFVALLQRNVLDPRHWATREELRIAIVIRIERTYHRHRRQRRLGRRTPIEFETIDQSALAA